MHPKVTNCPQTRSLGLYKLNPPARVLREFAQVDFGFVAAIFKILLANEGRVRPSPPKLAGRSEALARQCGFVVTKNERKCFAIMLRSNTPRNSPTASFQSPSTFTKTRCSCQKYIEKSTGYQVLLGNKKVPIFLSTYVIP